MNNQVSEKRKIDRFSISPPAWVDLARSGDDSRIVGTQILNISSDGAYLKLRPAEIEEDEVVGLYVLISVRKIAELFGIDEHVMLKVNGKVLRKDEVGAAVKFVGKRNVYSAQQDFLSGNPETLD